MPQRRADDSGAPKMRAGEKIEGRLGIIAGRGPLPCVLAESAAAHGLPLHIVGIRGEAREEIERFPHTWIKWGEIGKMFAALDKNGCGDLVIIGGVNRPDPGNVRFDRGAHTTLPFLLSLGKGGRGPLPPDGRGRQGPQGRPRRGFRRGSARGGGGC